MHVCTMDMQVQHLQDDSVVHMRSAFDAEAMMPMQ